MSMWHSSPLICDYERVLADARRSSTLATDRIKVIQGKENPCSAHSTG
jgi:hypothetical protein